MPITKHGATLSGTGAGANRFHAAMFPACDSAGEVMSVGAGVTTFWARDRVANTYFGAWDSGEIAAWKVADSFGAIMGFLGMPYGRTTR